MGITPLLASLLFAPEPPPFRLTFDGDIETAVIYNGFRHAGGGELSIGDFMVDLRFTAAKAYSLGEVGAYVDWLPEGNVLHFRNEHNSNNTDWLRGDGFVSRPFLLAGLKATWRDLSMLGGGFLASGIEPLQGIPTHYYLAMPAPILHSQHYDKGFRLDYNRDWLHLDVSIVNGDWAVGERDLFALSNSAHNSYPSYAAGARIDFLGLYVGGTGSYGDLGSYPGEKRRQNNVIGYLGGRYPLGPGEVEARLFAAYMERNPMLDGSGSHVSSVDTRSYGFEAAYRVGHFDFYGEVWEMRRNNNGPDGEIWLGEKDDAHGFGGGIRWRDPFRLTTGGATYLGVFVGRLEFEERQEIGIFDMGLNF